MSEKSKEIARQRVYQYIDINIRKLQKGAKYRFKPGSSGRTREKISLQTLNRLKKNGFKKGGV